MPGFDDVKAFKADDGERLTVVWWQDEATLRAWREEARHRVAQRLGRELWYQYYTLEVAEVIRTKTFQRPQAPSPSQGAALRRSWRLVAPSADRPALLRSRSTRSWVCDADSRFRKAPVSASWNC